MTELQMMMRLLYASTKSQVMYRTDFIIGVIGTLFYNATFIASIGIITSRFQDIGGWGMWELLLLYSLFELGHAGYSLFLMNMTYLNRFVMEGTLDIYFLRPYSIITQLNGQRMNFTGFVDVFIGVTGLTVAYLQLQPDWAIWHWALIVVFAISGAFIEYALALSMNCVTFVFPNARSLFGAYYQLVLIGQRYPLNIFAQAFQAILTFIFPLAFMNYYPALLLLGKPYGWIGWLAPVVAAVFTLVALKIFHVTIKHYTSTGS